MGNSNCAQGGTDKPILLTQESLNFVVEKTQASKEDVEEQHANFLQHYPDGKMDAKGFRTLMKKCYPDQDIEKLEKHIFRMYDINSDGKIDFREFMIVLTVISKGSPRENLEQIYRIFDINNDGSISKKEIHRVVKDLFALMGKEDNPTNATDKALADIAFQEMDTDHDSKVTKEEFIAACEGHEKISTMLALKIVDIFV